MKTFMIVLSAAVWLQGCCFPPRKEPPLPKDVVGWKNYQDGTTKFRGRLLLKKDESTNNGEVEIRVLELIPPDCPSEVGAFEHQARVRLQFRTLSDPNVVCSDIFPENGGGDLSFEVSYYTRTLWHLRRPRVGNQSEGRLGLFYSRWGLLRRNQVRINQDSGETGVGAA